MEEVFSTESQEAEQDPVCLSERGLVPLGSEGLVRMCGPTRRGITGLEGREPI